MKTNPYPPTTLTAGWQSLQDAQKAGKTIQFDVNGKDRWVDCSVDLSIDPTQYDVVRFRIKPVK